MGRLEDLSIEIAYKINDSKIDGGFTNITLATDNGHRFSAQRRLLAIRYACNKIDQLTRYNIATAIQNNLSYQVPFRVYTYYLEKDSPTPLSNPNVQAVLRIINSDTNEPYRQVSSDVLDEYKTTGYSDRDNYPDGLFTIENVLIGDNIAPNAPNFSYRSFVKKVESIAQNAFSEVKFVKLTPASFDSLERKVFNETLDTELKPYYAKYTVPVNWVFNAPPTLNLTSAGFDYTFQIHVREVLSMSVDAYPEKKYIRVSEQEFDNAERGILFRASGMATLPYTSLYSAEGSFLLGNFTPVNPNFNAARVFETTFIRSTESPETPFLKVPKDMLVDIQNKVGFEKVFEFAKDKIKPYKVSGTFTNGTFLPSPINFNFEYVQDVFRIGNGFRAIKVSMDVLLALQQGTRPTFLRDYDGFYGKYTASASIVGGQLQFTDPNLKFFSHIEDVVGIKSPLFYENGGEKFRKVSFERLREYQNGTAPLQNPNALPDGRTDDYLFAVNDTGVGFYPPTLNVPTVEVEYYGIPPCKLYAYKSEVFKVYPDTPDADQTGEIEYYGFSPNLVFYSESFEPELKYDIYPKEYTGSVLITYQGLPLSCEFFTADTDKVRFTGTVSGEGQMTYLGYPHYLRFFVADSDKLRLTGTSGLGSLTYIGKPPCILYTFRNGLVETFPDSNLSFSPLNAPTTITALVQRSHPPVAYLSQDLEYPIEFDAIVLDFALSYLYEENGDVEIAAQYARKAEQALASWIGTANIAVSAKESRRQSSNEPTS